MALVKDEVVVIKGTDYSEADRIITVFGQEYGKFSLLAKGVRKLESKNRPAVQTLSISRITFYEGRNLGVLVEAQVIEQLELDPDQLKNYGKVLLILNKLLPEEEEDSLLYEKVKKLLVEKIDLREINKFRFWVLEHLGYLPDMRSCVNCSSREDLDLVDISNMVMICKNCRSQVKGSNKFQQVSDLKFEGQELDQALDRYISGVIDA